MKLLNGGFWDVFSPFKFVQAVTFNLSTIASVVGIASGVSSIFGGSDSGGGGTSGAGHYDPYESQRPKYFRGLETLMGYGGTPGTPGSKNAWSYNDWVNANPTQAAGYGRGFGGQAFNIMNSFSQPYNAGLSNADSQKAYQDYITSLGGTEPTEGVSGNQAAINMVMNSPTYMGGYQSGQRTLNAGLARTGQIGSGAEQLALQNYGQDYFNQQYQNLYNQYTGLSKATDAPLSMANQNALNYNKEQAGWSAVAQGVQGISNNFNNLASNATWMPTSLQDNSQPFTANWGGGLDT